MLSTNNATALYPTLQQAAAAVGMITPEHILHVNRQAAAAFMAAQLPMSALTSTLFPHHHHLFSNWQAHLPVSVPISHSPPSSPPSPPSYPTTISLGKHALSPTSSPTTSNQGEAPAKKPRKISMRKEHNIISSPIEISMSVSDLYHTTGPISPPSSGSSPNSIHESQLILPITTVAAQIPPPPPPPTATTTIATTTSAVPANTTSKDNSRDKSFTCKICSRSFGYKHVLQNHERTHTGEKPFECPECHKRFTRDHHLKTHMRLHTGEKPYHCSHCDRQFVQVANLRRHLRVHTGERPYTCEVCEGKFSDSNQLKSHMLVHNGEKPFECDRCHMKFRRRHHFMNHKCGIQSPPTPSTSPTMSNEYTTLSDQKSTMGSSYGSEESVEMAAKSSSTLSPSSDDTPLDLSDEHTSYKTNEHHLSRLRSNYEPRRIIRLPKQIMRVQTDLPEQTEPEDLSLRTTRHFIIPEYMRRARELTPDEDIDLDDMSDIKPQIYIRSNALKRTNAELE